MQNYLSKNCRIHNFMLYLGFDTRHEKVVWRLDFSFWSFINVTLWLSCCLKIVPLWVIEWIHGSKCKSTLSHCHWDTGAFAEQRRDVSTETDRGGIEGGRTKSHEDVCCKWKTLIVDLEKGLYIYIYTWTQYLYSTYGYILYIYVRIYIYIYIHVQLFMNTVIVILRKALGIQVSPRAFM